MNTRGSQVSLRFVCATAMIAVGAVATVIGGEDPPVTGAVIARLQPGVDVTAFRDRYGNPLVQAEIASRGIYMFATPAGQSDAQFEAALRLDADVRWAERNYAADAPEASGRNFFLNEVASPGPFDNQLAWAQIGLPGAQAVSSGSGVLIAIVDSGIDAAHPIFAGRLSPVGRNFVPGAGPGDVADVGDGLDNDNDGDIDEIRGHGTHVAALAAHVAPGATILPVRVLDSDGDTNLFILAAGIYHAIDSGAQVINVSIGSTYRSDLIEDAVEEAVQAGIVVVASVGNLNRAAPQEYPAMFPGVISVGAVDAADRRAGFSNYNPLLTLCAPGDDIYSAVPGAHYAQWDGTSFATPLVAGTAALLLAHHPEWSAGPWRAAQVAGFLQASAANIDALNPGYAGLLGAGRIDAAAALALEVLISSKTTLATAGTQPAAVAAADLDGDSYPELIIAHAGSDTVAVLRNQGDGTFASPVLTSVPSGPSGIAVGDLTGDGRADVVLTCETAGRLVLLRNVGGGGLELLDTYVAQLGPEAVTLADFNADEALDVAIASSGANSVSVFFNRGSGQLFDSPSTPVGQRPVAIAAGDVDGDGDTDLVVANRDSASLTVLQNDGLGMMTTLATLASGNDPRSVQLADLDGDGQPDIVAANLDDDSLSVFWNQGGVFAPQSVEPLPPTTELNAVLVADVDCDGRADLIVVGGDAGFGVAGALMNRGGRDFAPMVVLRDLTGGDGLAAADMDRDGDREIIVLDEASALLAVLWNESCAAPAAGDTNCDRHIDLFDIDPFVLALLLPEAYAETYPTCDLRSADMDGDGRVSFLDIDAFVDALF